MDAAQLERALINLVFNAVDAAGTDRDDAGGCVWIRCGKKDRDNGLLRLIVEDNGPGVTPELRHRVFDPFFTTKHTGTGLGLAIVHRIAESNEGSVSAGGAEGGGAKFVLSLPLAREDAETESAGGIR